MPRRLAAFRRPGGQQPGDRPDLEQQRHGEPRQHGLTTATTVTATGLSNTSARYDLTGSATKLATLNILGPAPATLGNVNLFGDALLQIRQRSRGGTATGATLSLRNDPTPIWLNPGGVATPPSATPALWRSTKCRAVWQLPRRPGGQQPGDQRDLEQQRRRILGNTGLTTATTWSATRLSDGADQPDRQRHQAGDAEHPGAPATLGNVNLFGDALLQFASGAVGGTTAATFSLRNDPTPISSSTPAASPTPPSATPAPLAVDNAAPLAAFPATRGAATWRSARP